MKTRFTVLVCALVAAAIMSFSAPAKAGGGLLMFRVINISGNMTGFFAQALNDAGQMVGNRRFVASGGVAGTLAYKGRVTNDVASWGRLKGFAPLPPQSADTAYAASINEHGWVVGASMGQAAIWNPSSLDAIQFTGEEDATSLSDINTNGDVVGHMSLGNGLYGGFRWTKRNGDVLNLKGTAESFAAAINTAGEFTGFEKKAGETTSTLFFYSNELGYENNTAGQGYDINNRGTVAGHYSYPPIPCLKKPGQGVVRLGVSGYAYGVNDKDDVVGTTGGGAFYYSAARGTINLNTVIQGGLNGWNLQHAKAINNNRTIIGWGTLNGVQKSFMLIPVSE